MIQMSGAAAFRVLGDPTRLRLLSLLLVHKLTVQELTEILEMGQSRVSNSLRLLTDRGFLSSRRDGLWVFYRAVRNGRVRRKRMCSCRIAGTAWPIRQGLIGTTRPS